MHIQKEDWLRYNYLVLNLNYSTLKWKIKEMVGKSSSLGYMNREKLKREDKLQTSTKVTFIAFYK